MKNKNNKKNENACKNCKNNEVIENKVETMEKGKEYFEETNNQKEE